jgi:hypothetical protein
MNVDNLEEEPCTTNYEMEEDKLWLLDKHLKGFFGSVVYMHVPKHFMHICELKCELYLCRV